MTDGNRRTDEEPPGGRTGRPESDSGPSASVYAGLGLQLLASILLFLYLGQWLDRRFGTKGIFTVAGVLFGAGAAIYSVYRRLMAEQRRDDARRDEQRRR
jgi:F0F1-type ATP synthase assembly protein I